MGTIVRYTALYTQWNKDEEQFIICNNHYKITIYCPSFPLQMKTTNILTSAPIINCQYCSVLLTIIRLSCSQKCNDFQLISLISCNAYTIYKKIYFDHKTK